MSEKWSTVELEEIVKVTHGWAFPSAACRLPVGNYPRLLRIGDFARTSASNFTPETVQEYLGEYPSNYELAPGDLLLAMTCQSIGGEILGVSLRIPDNGMKYLHNQRLGLIKVLPGAPVDINFLDFALRDKSFNRHLYETSSGSKILHTAPERILQYKLRLPTLATQKRIAEVLLSLETLIGENQKLVESCQDLRRAVVGKALNASEFTIPLSAAAAFINGKNFTKNASGAGRPVIRTPEIRKGPSDGTVWSDIQTQSNFLATAGDILFVWSGSLMAQRWIYEEGLVNQHIFKVVPKEGVPPWLIMGQLEYQMPRFISVASDKATTMGHIQRRHLDQSVPMLSSEGIDELKLVINPIWEVELLLSLKNLQLVKTRDELLPLLLSGAITVNQVAA